MVIVLEMESKSEQLELFSEPIPLTPAEVHRFLSEGWPHPLSVKLTRNRVSMASIVFETTGGARLRLHEAFLQAPPDVLASLRTYIRTRRRTAWQTVQQFVWGITPETTGSRRLSSLCTKGEVYDLSEIQKEVNARFFEKNVRCHIGWGRPRTKRKARARRRSMCFGVYHRHGNVVRINPMLDEVSIPREFVVYIVFHEMLHAAVPSTVRHGRLVHHSAAFRALEQKFPGKREMEQLAKHLVNQGHV